MVLDAPAVAGAARDQILCGKPVGERSKRLVALKCLDRERMGGRAWIPADGPKGIPLSKSRPGSCQPRVKRPVVPVLDLLDGAPQRFEICRHGGSIQLSKVTYINMLI